MRRFHLHRTVDVTGVSGTGVVADGVVWPDGRVSLCWRTDALKTEEGKGSINVVQSIEEVALLHSHWGNTAIQWVDAVPSPDK